MAIEFECPSCGGALEVGDDAAGRLIRCGGCLAMLRVPGSDSGPPQAPASPFETGPPPPSRPRPRASDSPSERESLPRPNSERPRRLRREPPAAPGKGVFFWLVVIGFIMLFLVAGCCGGLLLIAPKGEWGEHQSKNGGFKVELPGDPQPDIEDAGGLKLEQGEHAEGAVLLRKVEYFMVIYRDIPGTKEREANARGKDKGRADEAQLQAAVDNLLQATGGMNVNRKRITVAGFPGYELEYQGRNGWHKARVVVADARLYTVLAGGPKPGSANARRFVESFTITDPALVAEGRRREKQQPDGDNEAKTEPNRKGPDWKGMLRKFNEAQLIDRARAAGGVAVEAATPPGVVPRPQLEPRPVAPPPRPVDD